MFQLICKKFYKKYNLKATDCPNANYIMDNGFYIPCGNTITNDEIDFVSEKIIKLGKKLIYIDNQDY